MAQKGKSEAVEETVDLPPTSRRNAQECLAEAKAQGLRNVRVGNIHLLGDWY